MILWQYISLCGVSQYMDIYGKPFLVRYVNVWQAIYGKVSQYVVVAANKHVLWSIRVGGSICLYLALEWLSRLTSSYFLCEKIDFRRLLCEKLAVNPQLTRRPSLVTNSSAQGCRICFKLRPKLTRKMNK